MILYELALADERTRAENANQAKSEFLASMTHELRTPLNAVLGFSQLLQMNMDNNLSDKQLNYIDLVITSGTNLLNLVNDILDLAIIEANRLPIFLENTYASHLVVNCVSQMMPAANAKGVEINNELNDNHHSEVRTDQRRYQQIATNLLSNAIKYNRYGGSTTITGQETGDGYFRVSVVDTGIGIPEEKHPEVFQMFQRFDKNSMTSTEGSGIGLALSKMLTERLGGRIGFESTIGVGSKFWFDMPLSSNCDVLVSSDG